MDYRSNIVEKSELSRRQFLKQSAFAGTAIFAGTGLLLAAGCAVNPVTGTNQLMMVSEQTEINIDRQQAPHQFSSDYGVVQDSSLNAYISEIGRAIALRTHRPSVPYSFRCVNATYINAYAFPGGSIAVTRGILLKLDNEAELAALLGHELGHVNARHSAQQMSKGTISSVLVGGLAAVVGSSNNQLGQLAQQIGMVGQGVFLARYSRDNEREADALGNQYMVNAGYSTSGFVGLMELLNSMSNGHNASAEMLFATHPMGSERYQTAIQMAQTTYSQSKSLPLNKERYMDRTASLRARQSLVSALQNGETALGNNRYDEAQRFFKNALKIDPTDYTAQIMMAKCMLVQKDYTNALKYAKEGEAIYPAEAQAQHVAGFACIHLKQYESALNYFSRYEQLLPGTPAPLFFKGYALEGMDRKSESAAQYQQYLKQVQEGDYAQHAYKRLQQWGYI
ncbi:MAG: M48 family metalloprotease [Desulfamplus sp.]|nr:M48 family metalloprotease [Desulfamplus sp.]